MEICSWIEPEEELLFAFTLSLSVDVGVESIGIASGVPQKFEIYLIVVVTVG